MVKCQTRGYARSTASGNSNGKHWRVYSRFDLKVNFFFVEELIWFWWALDFRLVFYTRGNPQWCAVAKRTFLASVSFGKTYLAILGYCWIAQTIILSWVIAILSIDHYRDHSLRKCETGAVICNCLYGFFICFIYRCSCTNPVVHS